MNVRSSHRFATVVWASLLLAIVAYFWPILRTYPAPTISTQYPDALEFIWTSWRLDHVIRGDEALYSTRYLYAPDGASLLLHTVAEGVLLPIGALFGGLSPVWRYNCACFALLAVNALSAVSLMRAISSSRASIVVGAFALTFNPFVLGHLGVGHLNFIGIAPLLEIIRWHLRTAMCSPRARADSARVIAAIAFLPFYNLYYLYFATLLSVAFFASRVRMMWVSLRGVGGDVLLFVLALIPALPHVWAVAVLAGSHSYSGDHSPSAHAADLFHYLAPGQPQRIGGASIFVTLRERFPLHAGETSLYVGLPILIAIVLSFRSRRWRVPIAIGAVSILLSFGPLLSVGGRAVVPTGLDTIVRSFLPLYPSVPARFGLIALLLWVPLGVAAIGSMKRGLRAVSLCVLAVELFPAPLQPFALAPLTSPIVALRDSSDVSAVLDTAPMPQQAMYRQTLHGKPLVGGFLSRRPKVLERSFKRNPFVRAIETPGPLDDEAIKGWCHLHADAVIVDRWRHEFLMKLEGAFVERAGDPDTVVMVPKPEVCSDSEQK